MVEPFRKQPFKKYVVSEK